MTQTRTIAGPATAPGPPHLWSGRGGHQATIPSPPDLPWCVPGLCVPEEPPIVLAHSETCCPNVGPWSGAAADAPAADSTTVPAARAAARRRRTGFMMNALRGDDTPCHPSKRLPRGAAQSRSTRWPCPTSMTFRKPSLQRNRTFHGFDHMALAVPRRRPNSPAGGRNRERIAAPPTAS
jgi:hypothetical protein